MCDCKQSPSCSPEHLLCFIASTCSAQGLGSSDTADPLVSQLRDIILAFHHSFKVYKTYHMLRHLANKNDPPNLQLASADPNNVACRHKCWQSYISRPHGL